MSGDFRKSKVIERLSNMNQNIPAPEPGPEQATQLGDTAACQLSVQGAGNQAAVFAVSSSCIIHYTRQQRQLWLDVLLPIMSVRPV